MVRALVAASLLAWTAAVVADPSGMDGHRLAGTVAMVERGKAIGSVEDVAVYFRPDTPVAFEVPAEPYVVSTFRKRFDPRVLPIAVGSSVRFPNQDPIFHNVFSLSPGNVFDLGLQGPGDGDSYSFDNVGLVRVYCNVHQSMVAHVLVLDTPFHTVAATDGRFELGGLPAGPGTLYVWHERARRTWSEAVTLPLDRELEVTLDTSARRVPSHSNKFGKPYRRARDRGRRY